MRTSDDIRGRDCHLSSVNRFAQKLAHDQLTLRHSRTEIQPPGNEKIRRAPLVIETSRTNSQNSTGSRAKAKPNPVTRCAMPIVTMETVRYAAHGRQNNYEPRYGPTHRQRNKRNEEQV